MQGLFQSWFFKMGIENVFKTTFLTEMIVSSSLRSIIRKSVISQIELYISVSWTEFYTSTSTH